MINCQNCMFAYNCKWKICVFLEEFPNVCGLLGDFCYVYDFLKKNQITISMSSQLRDLSKNSYHIVH